MKWYKSLTRKQKCNIRLAFEVATGLKLNDAYKLFSFSECMDILYQKLQMEGFNI